MDIELSYVRGTFGSPVTVILDIYKGVTYTSDLDYNGLPGRGPEFSFLDENETLSFSSIYNVTIDDPDQSGPVHVPNALMIYDDSWEGYYRVRVKLSWGNKTARSRGYYHPNGWEDAIENVRNGQEPGGANYLVSEVGFTVVSKYFNYISQPNKVPDLGNFTTPVIKPGDSGTYNFTVSNRYDKTITNVSIEIEFYMWATIEEAEAIYRIDGPPPRIKGTKQTLKSIDLPDIPKDGSESVIIHITTEKDTPKGTYFVRHRIIFDYDGRTFEMASRGYFTTEQWEGFDYTNLYPQLGVAGIIPDSSFSVKDPVPIWPLAVLIALCVLFGALAVVFYLAEEHGDQYPRLKKSLQYWSGKLEQRRRLLQQRLDELRREVDVPLEDDES